MKNFQRENAESFDTAAVHAGRGDFAALGVHAPPIDLSSTYPLADLDGAVASIDSLAAGGPPKGSAIYGRLHIPTVARFEAALAELEGAEEAVAFGSGMAALTACLLAFGGPGSHVAAQRPLYGGSDHLLASKLLGIEVTWASPSRLAEAIRPDTALVVVETPANPTLELVDVAALVAAAGRTPVLIDSTFATPVLQRPLAHGARLVLHSATKFLGGHGDVLAGVVACDAAAAAALRRVRVATGALLHPLAAYLLHRGLPTLALRVRAAQAGAEVLAGRLADHPAVRRVWYPGLAGGDPHGLIGRQMRGPGSLIAFEVDGGMEAAARVMAGVERIVPAVSLGATDSLIQHPAGLTHRIVGAEARAAAGITEGMLRLSVGLEDPDDLWRDLDRALVAAVAETATAEALVA